MAGVAIQPLLSSAATQPCALEPADACCKLSIRPAAAIIREQKDPEVKLWSRSILTHSPFCLAEAQVFPRTRVEFDKIHLLNCYTDWCSLSQDIVNLANSRHRYKIPSLGNAVTRPIYGAMIVQKNSSTSYYIWLVSRPLIM